MLQVQGLSVEVGGRLVVADASFTVMPRDKVGLVGRNGAGKTSLFKVLGGETEPAAGRVIRKGGFGYLPQDPRIDPSQEQRNAVTHILSGRGIDDALVRIEKLRIAMEEEPSERNVARYSKAQDDFATSGGYAAESEARRIAAGLGLPGDRLDLPVGVLSGGERRRVELSRILFAGSDVLLLDEPTNHLDVDAKTWLLDFMRAYRGAMLVISHDLELLDEAITRVIHLDRPQEDSIGHLVEYKGTYTQYRTSRALDEERLARQAMLQGKEIARLQGDRRPLRGQGHQGGDGPQQGEADRPPGGAAGARRPSATARCGCASPIRRRRASPCSPRRRLSKAYGGPPVFEDVTFDIGRGERLIVLGLNGAGKTSLLRILAGETTANLGQFSFGHNVNVGYYAQEHDNLLPRRVAARQPPRRGAARRDAHRDAAARAARDDGPVGREGRPGGGHAVGRGEDQAGVGDADERPQQPAAARRADEQPRPAEPPVGRRCAGGVEGHDRVRQPRHRVRRAARARPRCC